MMNETIWLALIAQAVPSPVAVPTTENALIWIALITMIGGIIKQYLDNRKVLGELALANVRSRASELKTESVAASLKADTIQVADRLASKSEEMHQDIRTIKIEVNDRLTQLLASKDAESIARVAAAHATGLADGKALASSSILKERTNEREENAASDISSNTIATAANTAALDANTRGAKS